MSDTPLTRFTVLVQRANGTVLTYRTTQPDATKAAQQARLYACNDDGGDEFDLPDYETIGVFDGEPCLCGTQGRLPAEQAKGEAQ